MADDIQQLPILATPPLRQVNAADPDSGSNGDGYLRDLPAKRQNKKSQTRNASPSPDRQAAAINPSVLLQDEVNLTRSARTIMGEQQPPLPAPDEPPPEETPPGQPPATPQHIHITA